MKKTLVIIYFLFMCFFNSWAQTINSDSAKYVSDFEYFIKILTETHPDPYSAYGNQIEFYRAKQNLRETIRKAHSDEEFVAHINTFLAKLEDGHTVLELPETNKKEEQVLIERKLPIRFKAAADQIFVQTSTKEYYDLVGLPLLAINDIPINELIEKAALLEPTENYAGKQYNMLIVLQNKRSLSHIIPNAELLTMTFQQGKTKIQRQIEWVKKPEWIYNISKSGINPDNNLLYTAIIGDNKKAGYMRWTATYSREMVEEVRKNNPQYLEININGIYEDNLKKSRSGNLDEDIAGIPALYPSLLSLLKQIKKENINSLIIDLRENGGGMTPLAIPLFYMIYGEKYLTFNSNDSYTRKVSPLLMQKFGTNLNDFNRSNHTTYTFGDYIFDSFMGYNPYMTIEDKRQQLRKGYFGKNIGTKEITEAEKYYNPHLKVYAITSPKTFSAAYHIAYFLRQAGNAKIVGVASRQAGNTFMESTNFELPQTKIRGSISNAKQIFFPDDPKLGKSLKPDYEMQWNDYKKYNFDDNAEILTILDNLTMR